jgi:inward rectifier potassium channel
LLLNFLLSLIFLADESGIYDGNADKSITKFELAFFFAVQTMDTIGYGALSPTGRYVNWMVVFASICSNFYWAVWTGIIFLRVARPSYIKYSFRFSDVACINCVESVYGGTHEDLESEYVQGPRTLSLQLADQRPNAVVCDGNFTLLYFHWQRVKGSKSKEYEFLTHELDFELNRQRGRNRSMSFSVPALSIPWKIVHKIDEVSPLYGKTIDDIKAERGEIIALLDGIDENTSENYQAR